MNPRLPGCGFFIHLARHFVSHKGSRIHGTTTSAKTGATDVAMAGNPGPERDRLYGMRIVLRALSDRLPGDDGACPLAAAACGVHRLRGMRHHLSGGRPGDEDVG